METLSFASLLPIEIEVTDLDSSGRKYILRELTAGGSIIYRDALTRATHMSDGKVVGMEGIAGTEALLLSHCLFEVYEHQGQRKERPVTIQQITAWKAKIVSKLFDKAVEISGLNVDEDVDTLKARIEKDTRRLKSLLGYEANGKKEGESAPKDWQPGTPSIYG